MPRARRRSNGDVTELVVIPWRKTRRHRSTDRLQEQSSAFAITPPSVFPRPVGLNDAKATKLQNGIELLIASGKMQMRISEPPDSNNVIKGVSILAFEASGGDFVGACLELGSSQPRLFLTGINQSPTRLDCSYDEGQEPYQLDVFAKGQEKTKRRVQVYKKGGDFARFVPIDEDTSGLRLSIEPLEVHANFERQPFFASFFSEVKDMNEIVLCYGTMELAGW